MTDVVQPSRSQHRPVSAGERPGNQPGSRHWGRWIVGGVATLLVLGVGAAFVFLHFFMGTPPAPLALPPLSAAAPAADASSIDGTWTAGSGSLAGYRVDEDFLWQRGSVVARTSAVTGQVVVVGSEATSASFRVDLTAVKANGKTQPQFARILGTATYPDATFNLTTPIIPGADPAINTTVTAKATGVLAIHGVSRPVSFELTARYRGQVLEEAGSIPVVFADWNIKGPGWPLQDHGVVEFLLVMHK